MSRGSSRLTPRQLLLLLFIDVVASVVLAEKELEEGDQRLSPRAKYRREQIIDLLNRTLHNRPTGAERDEGDEDEEEKLSKNKLAKQFRELWSPMATLADFQPRHVDDDEHQHRQQWSKLRQPVAYYPAPSTTIQCIYGTEFRPKGKTVDNSYRTYFNLSNLAKDTKFAKATVYFKASLTDAHKASKSKLNVHVHIYKYINPAEIGTAVDKQFPATIESEDFTWIEEDITSLAQGWVREPTTNNGVMIKFKVAGEATDGKTDFFHERQDSKSAFVELEFDTGHSLTSSSASRRINKRSIVETVEVTRAPSVAQIQRVSGTSPQLIPNDCAGDDDQLCCRRKLKVDFHAMGWRWVIAPIAYEAYYCAGRCDGEQLASSRHSKLSLATNKGLAGKNVSRLGSPCCAPTAIASLSMIYFDSDNAVHLKEVPDMMIVSCGCL